MTCCCCCSVTSDYVTPSPTTWTVAHEASLSFTVFWRLLITCPLSQWCYLTISSSAAPVSSCPQYFPASGSFLMSAIRIKWPKYWRFSFSISPSKEYSGLISIRTDLVRSACCPRDSQESKTIALTIWTFVGKVISLLFNNLSRFAMDFLPRSNHLLILWLYSPSTVILEPKKIIFATVAIFPHLFPMKWWYWVAWS